MLIIRGSIHKSKANTCEQLQSHYRVIRAIVVATTKCQQKGWKRLISRGRGCVLHSINMERKHRSLQLMKSLRLHQLQMIFMGSPVRQPYEPQSERSLELVEIITWWSVRGSHTTSRRGSLKAAWIWLVNVPGVNRPATAVAPVWLANFRIARYQLPGKSK